MKAACERRFQFIRFNSKPVKIPGLKSLSVSVCVMWQILPREVEDFEGCQVFYDSHSETTDTHTLICINWMRPRKARKKKTNKATTPVSGCLDSVHLDFYNSTVIFFPHGGLQQDSIRPLLFSFSVTFRPVTVQNSPFLCGSRTPKTTATTNRSELE